MVTFQSKLTVTRPFLQQRRSNLLTRLSCHSSYYVCVALSGKINSISPKGLSHKTYTVQSRFLRTLSRFKIPPRFLGIPMENPEKMVSLTTRNARVLPRKGHTSKNCELCKKHGGTHMTHNTGVCKKYGKE